MARARCDEHRPEADGRDWLAYGLPLGYPDTAAVCEVAGCERPARLWLTDDERKAFETGGRVFALADGTRLRVADDLFPD